MHVGMSRVTIREKKTIKSEIKRENIIKFWKYSINGKEYKKWATEE